MLSAIVFILVSFGAAACLSSWRTPAADRTYAVVFLAYLIGFLLWLFSQVWAFYRL